MLHLKFDVDEADSIEQQCIDAVRIADLLRIGVHFYWEDVYPVSACPGHNPTIMAEEARKMKAKLKL